MALKIQLKSFFIYAFASGINALLGLITTAYLTQKLTTDDFGKIGLYLSIFNILMPIVSLSLPALLNKEYYYAHDHIKFISTSIISIIIIGISLLAIAPLLIYIFDFIDFIVK